MRGGKQILCKEKSLLNKNSDVNTDYARIELRLARDLHISIANPENNEEYQ